MNHFIWNADPILFHFGFLKIRWYGLLFATGFLAGYYIEQWIYQRENKDIEKLDNLLVVIMAGTIIVARLGHCLFYDPVYYFSHPLKFLAVWEGGLASHGGAIGILTALFIYQKQQKESYLWFLDRIAIPTALAAILIRTGNFFNSEIIGIKSSLPWAVIFQRIDNIPRHPAQLYEAVSYLLIFIIVFSIYKRSDLKKLKDGKITGIFLFLVFTSRFFIEFIKSRQAAYILPIPLNTGQLLSIPFIIAGALLYIKKR